MSAPISTPCINVCVIDPLSALCIGCGRTAAEIGAWMTMSEADRLAIMAGLAERQTAARSRTARGGRVTARGGRARPAALMRFILPVTVLGVAWVVLLMTPRIYFCLACATSSSPAPRSAFRCCCGSLCPAGVQRGRATLRASPQGR